MCDGAQNSRKGRATILTYSSIPDFDMLRTAMRLAAALIAATFAASVFAKLPPQTDEAKAQAAEADAKAEWTDKDGLRVSQQPQGGWKGCSGPGRDGSMRRCRSLYVDDDAGGTQAARSLGRAFTARNGRLVRKREGN